jgi:hypothetical protein
MDLRQTPLVIVCALLLALAGSAPASAAPERGQLPQTAPCYLAAMQALTRKGAIYSQGGELADDPVMADGAPYPRTGPDSFDCSGLVWWSYAQAGVSIGSTTYQQLNDGAPIPCTIDDLAGDATTCWTLGDLIFLRYSGGQHVAIYVGSGLFLDCYNHATGCILHDVKEDSFYQRHFLMGRRIVSGCEGMTNDPGEAGQLPPGVVVTPGFELVPALLAPVSLYLPWQCGACLDGQTPIEPMEEPEVSWYDMGSWFNWLGVQLWNRVALPIICWMLLIAAAILAVTQDAVNAIFVGGFNYFWRLLVLFLLYFRETVYSAWIFFALIRLQAWQIWAAAIQALLHLESILSLAQTLLDLAAEMLQSIIDLIISVAQPLLYFFALFFTLVPALVTAAFNQTPPPQLQEVSNFFLFVWTKDILQAIADSKLGWAWTAFIALFYVSFVMWLIDEGGQLNS